MDEKLMSYTFLKVITMQKFLNDEYKEDIKCLSNPLCCTFVLSTLLVAIIFPIVAVYCLNSRTCPPYMGEVFLGIGINIDFFIVVFVGIPCSTRILLNCCYEVPKVPKVPSPPKSKPPKWAFTSFSESEKGRSKSLNYTENPLTAKEKARSRSRSKSDSEV
jgi:hypothetical protein